MKRATLVGVDQAHMAPLPLLPTGAAMHAVLEKCKMHRSYRGKCLTKHASLQPAECFTVVLVPSFVE